jgi:hypothetical protein
MRFEQTDLLSYAGIESEVDGLLRAYLDTTLVSLANTANGNEAKYWLDVVALRNKVFEKPSPQSYRYWFDIRADYWWQRPKELLQQLVDELVPATYLRILYEEAVALFARLSHIEDSTGKEKALAKPESEKHADLYVFKALLAQLPAA